MIELTPTDISLINRLQKDFPICNDPFGEIADEIGIAKNDIVRRISELKQCGAIRRLGGVLNHKKAGFSTLAALKVPPNRVDEIAQLVNSFKQVNHNYLREHEYNIWFVVTAATQQIIQSTLEEIEVVSKCSLINLPMIKSYHIDLAFNL